MHPDVATTAFLERLLGPIARIEQRAHPEQTSFPLYELRVSLADGSTLNVVLKDLEWAGLSEAARRAKPGFLHDPSREIETYRRILSTTSGGTAVFYGAEGPRLLLENVGGKALWQIGELDVWCSVARSVASLHRELAGHTDDSWLVRYTADFYQLWLERAVAFAGPLPAVMSCHDDVVERLLTLPQSVIHGELYPSNIIVSGPRVCPVDWELAGAGPALLDLAALTTGWVGNDLDAMVAAYGIVDPDDLDCCRLHLALRWLGWSREWYPPAAHAHDWRAEAVGAAERLGTTRSL